MNKHPDSGRPGTENLEILSNLHKRLNGKDSEFYTSLLQSFEQRQALSERQWYWIDQLASRCVKGVSDYGHRTGRCQLCKRKLTDPKSLKYGYGPVCAHQNHLPYG